MYGRYRLGANDFAVARVLISKTREKKKKDKEKIEEEKKGEEEE